MTNWNEIAQQHHAAMMEKGFHDNYSHTKLLLWCIGEVGELYAAWRKNRRADMAAWENHGGLEKMMAFQGGIVFPPYYEDLIKGSIEEEFADIALIMLHFSAANNININPAGFVQKGSPIEVLMRIAKYIGYIDNLVCNLSDNGDDIKQDWRQVERYVNSIFTNLEVVAKDLDINLEEQVELKMQYNKTRPYKHGDKN